ncbi:hypothetical protein Goshw_025946 [Gossypium schwendimanii]|uniref:Uncharacterized protein n=1 Tax=Gossypium schwendimanii TaxID=34291 RepID=A0A7J9L6T3_GOSSC|nr:hypothetical protein [Gossypium schwendimanii]
MAFVEDGEVQCPKGQSSGVFRWWEESFYSHVRGGIPPVEDGEMSIYYVMGFCIKLA